MLHAREDETDHRVPEVVASVAHRLKQSPSSQDIRAWAADSGLDDADDWPIVKIELRRQLGIDYDHVAGLQVAIDALRLAHAACGPSRESDSASVSALHDGHPDI